MIELMGLSVIEMSVDSTEWCCMGIGYRVESYLVEAWYASVT